MKEYDFEKNKKLGLNLDKLTNGSNKKVWWKCVKGHEWQSKITTRNYGYKNCPVCKNSK